MSRAATAARNRMRAAAVVLEPPWKLNAWRKVLLSSPKLLGTSKTLSRVWSGEKPVATQESRC